MGSVSDRSGPSREATGEGSVYRQADDYDRGMPYDPSDYPGHGTGLFFVGLEATGGVYAFALDLNGSAAF